MLKLCRNLSLHKFLLCLFLGMKMLAPSINCITILTVAGTRPYHVTLGNMMKQFTVLLFSVRCKIESVTLKLNVMQSQ